MPAVSPLPDCDAGVQEDAHDLHELHGSHRVSAHKTNIGRRWSAHPTTNTVACSTNGADAKNPAEQTTVVPGAKPDSPAPLASAAGQARIARIRPVQLQPPQYKDLAAMQREPAECQHAEAKKGCEYCERFGPREAFKAHPRIAKGMWIGGNVQITKNHKGQECYLPDPKWPGWVYRTNDSNGETVFYQTDDRKPKYDMLDYDGQNTSHWPRLEVEAGSQSDDEDWD